MYLVDTSVWIRHFSRADTLDLRDICDPEERVLCLPVYQEILQGIREDAAFRRLKRILDAALVVDDPLDRELFVDAIGLYRLARKQGITVRSSIDCLIGASAIRHGLTVLHSDRDFPALARVSRLCEETA
jgi:hypothetical protein